MQDDMLRIVTCALIASLTLQSPAQPPKPGVKAAGVKIPIERLKPEAVFTVPGVPDWLAVDEAAVWVSNKPKDSISKLDAKTNTVTATVAVGKRPCSGLAIGFDSVWVPNCGDATTPPSLSRVDVKTGTVATIKTTIGNTEGAIATGAGSVW